MEKAGITIFFTFLKYNLGGKEEMNKVIADIDWKQLYAFSSDQAILGLCFEGVERLGREYPDELKQNPMGRDLLMTWMGASQQIRRQNMKVNAVAGKLYSKFREDGLRCCILKGQGNALMYPNSYSRTPGDIDVWIDASRERIMEYAQKKFELEDDIRLQHLETSLDGVPVELHFFPCSMNNPIYHARLQKWFEAECGSAMLAYCGAARWGRGYCYTNKPSLLRREGCNRPPVLRTATL